MTPEEKTNKIADLAIGWGRDKNRLAAVEAIVRDSRLWQPTQAAMQVRGQLIEALGLGVGDLALPSGDGCVTSGGGNVSCSTKEDSPRLPAGGLTSNDFTGVE